MSIAARKSPPRWNAPVPSVVLSNIRLARFTEPLLICSTPVVALYCGVSPAGATFFNLGRGALRGPDQTNYNMSLFKHFRIREVFDLELRGEAYNITNSSHFANPMTNLSSPDFGRALNTGAIGNRQLNVGFRALF